MHPAHNHREVVDDFIEDERPGRRPPHDQALFVAPARLLDIDIHSAHGIDDKVWLEGDIQLMLRCDAIYAIPGWDSSEGAKVEVKVATENNLPVLYNDADLFKYLEAK